MTYKQRHIPGGEWLYLRIYTGFKTADKIVLNVLFPFSADLRKKGKIANWFFIRYADPDFHIRFRIKIVSPDDYSAIVRKLNIILDPFLKQGLIWKVESGTYMPETERYGVDSMWAAEQMFMFDSEAFCQFLSADISGNAELRWLYAMASIDCLLDDFNYNLSQKKDLLLVLSKSFGQEFGKGKLLAKQVSVKYRLKRNEVLRLLSKDEIMDYAVIHQSLGRRSHEALHAVEEILALYDNEKLSIEKNDLISSFIHMSMNRIVRVRARLHEMIVYDLLFRHYKSLHHHR